MAHYSILPPSATPAAARVLLGKGSRAFGDGFVSILLPAYLLALGFDALAIGILTAVTLLGSAVTTIAAGFLTPRIGMHRMFLAAAVLMVVTGLGFAGFTTYGPLLVVACIGTLNPTAGDVSLFLPLEQAFLAGEVSARERTGMFARYHLIGGVCSALGAQATALPSIAGGAMAPVDAMRALFVVYALLGVVAAVLYGPVGGTAAAPDVRALGPSRRRVLGLAALFSVDALGGGFVVQSLLALWLFERFGLSLAAAATLFFWLNLLTAASYAAAPAIARRIGLINTMVFTHLPANLCLLLAAFAPSLPLATALLSLRAVLSQMDVPTRASYVMAVVTPPERTAAASVTAVPRSLAAAISPAASGYLLTLSVFGWPLVLGAGLKIAYDVALLLLFRRVQPPEEVRARTQA